MKVVVTCNTPTGSKIIFTTNDLQDADTPINMQVAMCSFLWNTYKAGVLSLYMNEESSNKYDSFHIQDRLDEFMKVDHDCENSQMDEIDMAFSADKQWLLDHIFTPFQYIPDFTSNQFTDFQRSQIRRAIHATNYSQLLDIAMADIHEFALTCIYRSEIGRAVTSTQIYSIAGNVYTFKVSLFPSPVPAVSATEVPVTEESYKYIDA